MNNDGKTAGMKPVPGGAPQGTRLEIILFLILINFAGFHKFEVLNNLGKHKKVPLAKRTPMINKHLKYSED